MVFFSVDAGWLTQHYTPVGISKNLVPTSTVSLLKKLSVEDFLLLPGYHRQVYIKKLLFLHKVKPAVVGFTGTGPTLSST